MTKEEYEAIKMLNWGELDEGYKELIINKANYFIECNKLDEDDLDEFDIED